MLFRTAVDSEGEEIFALYRSVIGEEGCTWSEDYPDREILEDDLRREAIVVAVDGGRIVGAISADADPNTDALDVWSEELSPAVELARVVVRRDYRNRGIAKELFRAINARMRERGYAASHYLVSPGNLAALRAYEKLGYRKCGECDLYDHHWYCFEMKLA